MTQAPADEDALALAEGFEPRTAQDWQALVAEVLNKRRPEDKHLDGAAAEAALRVTLDGGLVTEPLYLRSDRPLGVPGAMPFTRGRELRDPQLPWDVRQVHDDPDAERSRAAVLADLEHGVTSVWVHVGADGIAASDLATVLADVHLDLAPLAVSSFDDQSAAATALLELTAGRPSAGGDLGLDPIGAAARTGGTPDLQPLADFAADAHDRGTWTAITVDARVLHEAGASEVDALAAAVAAGVAYLRHLVDSGERGMDVADAFAQITFRVPAVADQFLTAASLRALRRVWARVGEASGVPADRCGAAIHAVTSARMLTREDPFVNVLRNTLAVFGASIGGADAITVLPHDTVAGLPEAFSRRLARNTQILLADESNVGRVTDPGGGSWYLESLTDEVAAAVWGRFQEIERAGGAVAALADGLFARWAAEGRHARADALANRSRPITGVSTFPNLADTALARRPRAALPSSDGALAPHRDAEVFEALRDRARTLTDPAVTVATLGSQREFGARQTFVVNLLAVGGIRAADPGEGAAPVAVIASNAAGYLAHGAAAVDQLRAAGAERVLVAGKARELGEQADLVDGEVFDGMDLVAFLDDILERLGAPAEGARP